MAGCRGDVGCLAQRREIRRQLLKWMPTTALLLGLERVLEDIMDDASWLKVRADLFPSGQIPPRPAFTCNCRAEPKPRDFDAAEPCYVCKGKMASSPEEGNTAQTAVGDKCVQLLTDGKDQQSPRALSYAQEPNRHSSPVNEIATSAQDRNGSPNGQTLNLSVHSATRCSPHIVATSLNCKVGECEVDKQSEVANEVPTVVSTDPSTYTANLPPHLLPWVFSSHLQSFMHNQQMRRKFLGETITADSTRAGYLDDRQQQPLDLSAKSQSYLGIANGSNGAPLSCEDLISRVLNVNKTSPRGRRRDQSKRAYTEEDLQAALRDIQGGKLGTRRAAVIYGIPRSTLRNKVYKLAMEKERNKKLLEQQNSASGSSSSVYSCSPTCKENGIIDHSSPMSYIKNFSPFMKNNDDQQGNENNAALEFTLAQLMSSIPKLALTPDSKTTPGEVRSSLSLYPQLRSLVVKLIEDRFLEEIENNKSKEMNCSNHNSGVSDNHNSTSKSDLNIPSYLPTCNGTAKGFEALEKDAGRSDSSHALPTTPSTLKEVIAQMLNQKIEKDLDESCQGRNLSNIQEKMLDFDNSTSISSVDLQSFKQDVQNKRKCIAVSSSGTIGGKGSRPKRGKYRNYNRENLLKAVQAVQSGEMSVHRAGSYYGVPHSTLEYKVKERHLNKTKNRKDAFSHSKYLNSSPTMVTAYSCINDSEQEKEISGTKTSSVETEEDIDENGKDNLFFNDAEPKAFKKQKMECDNDDLHSTVAQSNSLIPSPFSFWGSSLLNPFISTQLTPETFYASHMIRRFQEVAAKACAASTANTYSSSTSSRPSTPASTGSSPPTTCADLSGSSFSNSSSYTFQGSVLDALLRSKGCPQINEFSRNRNDEVQNASHKNILSSANMASNYPSSHATLSIEEDNSDSVPQTPLFFPPPGINAFNTFCSLPSLLATKSSLSASCNMPSIEPVNDAIPNETSYEKMATTSSKEL